MNRRVPDFALACCLVLPASITAQETRISILSSLKTPPCTTMSKTPAVKPGELETVEYRCSGAGGWSVRLVVQGISVTAAFELPAAGRTKPQIAADFEVGPHVEWRGFRGVSGFTVDSAIVRVAVGRSENGRLLSVLAVLGVRDGRMCVAALLDANAGGDPAAEARRMADSQPLDCPESGPRVVAGETSAVRAVLERLRQLPR